MFWKKLLLAHLLCGAGVCAYAQTRFNLVRPELIQNRLYLYKGTDFDREEALRKLFLDVGCKEPQLREQRVPYRKLPNVICSLPGTSDDVIVVGAHFDHVSEGEGIVDNWSGAALLPSLFQSLSSTSRSHTFVFVGFSGEEAGEVGSGFYMSQLSKAQAAHIKLMVNLDTLGLGPSKIWVSRSDGYAVKLLAATADLLKLPVAGVNVDGFGESDEEPFIRRGIRTITIHSLTSQTAQILHTPSDTPSAIHFQEYYDTYHLLAGYLSILDVRLDSGGSPSK